MMESISITLLIIGFSFYLFLHFIFRQIVVNIFKLSEIDAYIIACRVVSAVQAISAVVVGAIIASSCQDIMKDVHWLTNMYLYFGFPYLLYDTWAMYAYNIRLHSQYYSHLDTGKKIQRFVIRNKLIVAHHILLPCVILPVILLYREDRGDFFFGVFYMIEMVVPLISAREILIQLNMKYTKLYTVTSILLIITFFICRILVFPYLYHAYAVYANIPLILVPVNIPIKCNVSCLLILAPQIYWFALMLKVLKKALSVHYDKTDKNCNSYSSNTVKVN